MQNRIFENLEKEIIDQRFNFIKSLNEVTKLLSSAPVKTSLIYPYNGSDKKNVLMSKIESLHAETSKILSDEKANYETITKLNGLWSDISQELKKLLPSEKIRLLKKINEDIPAQAEAVDNLFKDDQKLKTLLKPKIADEKSDAAILDFEKNFQNKLKDLAKTGQMGEKQLPVIRKLELTREYMNLRSWITTLDKIEKISADNSLTRAPSYRTRADFYNLEKTAKISTKRATQIRDFVLPSSRLFVPPTEKINRIPEKKQLFLDLLLNFGGPLLPQQNELGIQLTLPGITALEHYTHQLTESVANSPAAKGAFAEATLAFAQIGNKLKADFREALKNDYVQRHEAKDDPLDSDHIKARNEDIRREMGKVWNALCKAELILKFQNQFVDNAKKFLENANNSSFIGSQLITRPAHHQLVRIYESQLSNEVKSLLESITIAGNLRQGITEKGDIPKLSHFVKQELGVDVDSIQSAEERIKLLSATGMLIQKYASLLDAFSKINNLAINKTEPQKNAKFKAELMKFDPDFFTKNGKNTSFNERVVILENIIKQYDAGLNHLIKLFPELENQIVKNDAPSTWLSTPNAMTKKLLELDPGFFKKDLNEKVESLKEINQALEPTTLHFSPSPSATPSLASPLNQANSFSSLGPQPPLPAPPTPKKPQSLPPDEATALSWPGSPLGSSLLSTSSITSGLANFRMPTPTPTPAPAPPPLPTSTSTQNIANFNSVRPNRTDSDEQAFHQIAMAQQAMQKAALFAQRRRESSILKDSKKANEAESLIQAAKANFPSGKEINYHFSTTPPKPVFVNPQQTGAVRFTPPLIDTGPSKGYNK